MKNILYSNEFLKDRLAFAAMRGSTVYQNEFNRLSNLKVHRLDKPTIKEILQTYWSDFYDKFKDNLRPSIIKNIEALISCKDLSRGYFFYECPNCINYHLTGFSCNSRFCSSCGQKYREQRSLNIQSKLIKCPHRHFVFSVPFDLRPFFWKCRKLFDCLFHAVNDALDLVLSKSKAAKKSDERVGYVAFLHTSGRSLNIHPHLHVLIAEKTIDKLGKQKNMHYFHFKRLKVSFMYCFLNRTNLAIKESNDHSLYKSFNIIRSQVIKKYKDGFYVYGPANKNSKSYIKSSKNTADYIARYASQPPLSESNILSWDKDYSTITWTYTPHEDKDNPVTVVDDAFDFIKKIIRHIPDSKTHVLRYYGFYANRASYRINNINKLFSSNSISYLKSQLKWRIMIKRTYKYDPLLCLCGHVMILNLDSSYFGKYDWRDFNE